MRGTYKLLDFIVENYVKIITLFFITTALTIALIIFDIFIIPNFLGFSDDKIKDVNTLLNDLSIAIFASCIFYYIVEYFPELRRTKIAKKSILPFINSIIFNSITILNIHTLVYLPKKNETSKIAINTKEEVNWLLDHLNSLSELRTHILKNVFINSLDDDLVEFIEDFNIESFKAQFQNLQNRIESELKINSTLSNDLVKEEQDSLNEFIKKLTKFYNDIKPYSSIKNELFYLDK